MISQPTQSNEEELVKKANELRDEFLKLFAAIKTESGKNTQVWVANIIAVSQQIFSELTKPVKDQRSQNNRTYAKIVERYLKVNPLINLKIIEIRENKNSAPLKPFDKTLRWWILFPPIFLVLICYFSGMADNFGSIVQERDAALPTLIGVFANFLVIIFLLINFQMSRFKNFPATDVGKGAKIFQTFWKYCLYAWLAMYLILIIENSYLLIFANRINNSDGLLWPTKVVPNNWFIILPWLANLASAVNSAFMYMCFLVLSTNIPLRKQNMRFRVRFHYFLIILSFLLLLSLIDELVNGNAIFNGLAMTLFLSFMASAFLLLASKLDSPLFRTQIKIFTLGCIYFYGSTMAIFAIVQTGSVSAVSIMALLIFCIGKLIFGLHINERIRPIDGGNSNEIITYLESYY